MDVDLTTFRAGLNTLSRGAQRKIFTTASHLDWARDYQDIRRDLTAIVETVTGQHGQAAVELSRALYDTTRTGNTLSEYFADALVNPPSREEIEAATRASIRHATTGNPAATARELSAWGAHQIREQAFDNLAANMSRDPNVKRYEVTLSGSGCQLCHDTALMIEALSPGEKPDHWFHPNCKCNIAPAWNKMPKPRKAAQWKEPPCPAYTLTTEDWDVALHGRGSKGGHFDPNGVNTWPGKSFAPVRMSDRDVRAAIQATLDAPQKVTIRGTTTRREREVDRVIWRVDTHPDRITGRTTLGHAYPVSGDGVMKNPPKGSPSGMSRFAVPLDRALLAIN
jgi:hypothetical protein